MIGLRARSRSWRETEYTVLDIEATGLDFAEDEIVSFGVVPIVHGRISLAGAHYRVVRPVGSVETDAIRVHGLRPDELAEAPPLSDVVDELAGLLEGRQLVAHAAGVELGFLHESRALRGRRWPRRAIDVLGLAVELEARGGAARGPSPRLADLARAYGVPHGRSHHAFSDALATALLFLVLATGLEQLGFGTARHIARAGRPQSATEFFSAPP